MKSPKYLIAIPAYNCANQLPRVINKASSLDSIEKLIVVDNVSQDDTVEKARVIINELNDSRIELYQNENNYGLGGTFKNCLYFAIQNNYDYLIFLHGDDQADPTDIKKIVNCLKQSPDIDAILGARFMKGSVLAGYSKKREIANRIINIIFSLILRRKIYEIGSGLNVFKTKTLASLDWKFWPNHIAFDIYVLLDLLKLKTIFMPIHWNESDQKSTTSNIGVTIKIFTALFHWFRKKKYHYNQNYNFKRIV